MCNKIPTSPELHQKAVKIELPADLMWTLAEVKKQAQQITCWDPNWLDKKASKDYKKDLVQKFESQLHGKKITNIIFFQNNQPLLTDEVPLWILIGKVQIDEVYYPFIWEQVYQKIWEHDILDTLDLHIQPNGNLAGKIKVNDRWYPFFWKKVITRIWWRDIYDCQYIHTQANGQFTGCVKLWPYSDLMIPFIDHKLVTEIGWKFLYWVSEYHTRPDGKTSWKAKIKWEIDNFLPFIWDKYYKTIGWILGFNWEKIYNTTWVRTLSNGKIVWIVFLFDSKRYPFIGTKTIKKVHWNNIETIKIRKNTNWEYVWLVELKWEVHEMTDKELFWVTI